MDSEKDLPFILRHRMKLVALGHVALWAASYVLAFGLKFDWQYVPKYADVFLLWMTVLIGLRFVVGLSMGIYRGLWRYSGAPEVLALFKTTVISTAMFMIFILLFGFRTFPRSIFAIEFLIAMALTSGLRFFIRQSYEAVQALQAADKERLRILIIGAGETGISLLREVQKTQSKRYDIVGFLDDDARKVGRDIHGAHVLGPVQQVVSICQEHRVAEVILAMPSAPRQRMQSIITMCKDAKIKTRVVPGLASLIDGRVSINDVRDVEIDDLLGREAVELDETLVREMISGEIVLVTGAGGSIGSELCRQILAYQPLKLILLEQAENSLFHIYRELSKRPGDTELVQCVADIYDHHRVEAVFAYHQPTTVLHAAAHKPVPRMEDNPSEAVKNNIVGTKNVADVASRFGARRFVMISTDKAVNPTSVMGATKRVAELYIQAKDVDSSTKYVAVRFGNVLGSAGSVIPIFKQQIAVGGPVTVTHPDMERYFMTIPEASQLVLQAAAMGDGGEVFILDMGEPVKIVDLAKALIELSGFTPDEDIDIVFSGVRPGEKLYEELSTQGEDADKTRHKKIFTGRVQSGDLAAVTRHIDFLHQGVDQKSPKQIRDAIQELIPEYRPTVLGDRNLKLKTRAQSIVAPAPVPAAVPGPDLIQ